MSQTIVIFGASGDLTCRKLVPALYELHRKKRLPEETRIVGFSRDAAERRGLAGEAGREHGRSFVGAGFDAGGLASLRPVDLLPARRHRQGRTISRRWPSSWTSLEGSAGGDADLLPVHRAAVLRAGRSPSSARRAWPTKSRRPRRHGGRKALRHRSGHRHELNDEVHRGLRREPGLPHRPLPGQGDRAEHPGAAVRQQHLRAALEPQLHRPRADHRGRGPDGRPSRRPTTTRRACCATCSRTTCCNC